MTAKRASTIGFDDCSVFYDINLPVLIVIAEIRLPIDPIPAINPNFDKELLNSVFVHLTVIS